MGSVQSLTAGSIAAAASGRLVSGDPDRVVTGCAIDTRTLRPGELFVAIVGARDGHAFVADALARGAAGAMVQRRGTGAADGTVVLIEVEDTTRALQDLGRAVRRQSGARVVAITGSAGKTTTKEAIAEFLAARHRVVKNRGNLNNHLGLPLSLLELRHGADVAVMELGMNHAGEIRVLVGIAEPEVRVWTNVGDAHLGYFDSREAIAEAKAEILEAARPEHLLICNADDPLVMARAPRFAGRIVTFGAAAGANVRAADIEDRGLDGSRARVQTPSGETVLNVPLLGRGNLSNVLAAAAVAVEMGVPLGEIRARAAALKAAAHRGAVLRLGRGLTIIDDSYNSSPSALQQALRVVGAERRAPRKAAVLGEMLELGDHARELHQSCGRAAAEAGLDRLITVGGDAARALGDAAVAAGLPRDRVTWVAESGAAADEIVPWLEAGDLLLVKGSRGIRTDVVVDRIRAELA